MLSQLAHMPWLHRWNSRLFIASVGLAPFSFNPSFGVPVAGLVSLRIGFYQVICVLFVVSMLPQLWAQRSAVYKQPLVIAALVVLGGLAASSPLRSVHPGRSLLVSLSIIFLCLLLLAGWQYARQLRKDTWRQLLQFSGGIAVLVCMFSLLQLIASTAGVANSTVGLCANCGEEVFGFARISGFAAEPQFLASSLLPAFLGSLVISLRALSRGSFVVLASTSLVIALTLSRGGYVAAIAGVIAAFTVLGYLKVLDRRRTFLCLGVMFASTLLAVALMVASASFRYHGQNKAIAGDTLNTIVEHTSLGTLSLHSDVPPPVTTPPPETTQTFTSPGVITASQDDRQNAASIALNWWRSSFGWRLFGLGFGNLGSYAHQQDPAAYSLSFTVYIQYVFILVEAGLLGLAAFVWLLMRGIYRCWLVAIRSRQTPAIILFSLLLAFAVQFSFFGSYINVLYVWLLMGVGLGYHLRREEDRL